MYFGLWEFNKLLYLYYNIHNASLKAAASQNPSSHLDEDQGFESFERSEYIPETET